MFPEAEKMTDTYDTKIVKAVGDESDAPLMKQAGEIIKNGGLVAIPTETVYGLAGNALDPGASEKIYSVKGRPSDNPLIVHIAETQALQRITDFVPEKARRLSDRFWPGPLTMIFNKTDLVPRETTGGLDTVAVRMPVNVIARNFIKAAGGYIAAPSANLSGRPSCTSAAHVYEDLKGKIPLIIDGGEVGIGLESTIVDMTEEVPVLLRPGYISPEDLREVLGELRIDPNIGGLKDEKNLRPRAPGMKYRHYAPRGELSVVCGSLKDCVDRINSDCALHMSRGETCGVMCMSGEVDYYRADVVKSLGGSYEDAARALFKVLREMDEEGISFIYIRAFENEGLGMALMNRVIRAAGHRIINV